MVASDVTNRSSAASSLHHANAPKVTGSAPSAISQQLLLQLGANMSNNVVHQSSKSSTRPTTNTKTAVSVPCHIKNDPMVSLASHIIHTLFGSIVETVADCLQCRGPLTLRELVSYLIPNHARATHSPSRTMMHRNIDTSEFSGRNQNRNGTQSSTSILTLPQIKAALLVLLQHSILSITTKRSPATNNASGGHEKSKFTARNTTIYRYHPIKAIYMNFRYAKFVEYIRKAMVVGSSNTASANYTSELSPSVGLVEELLLFGRLTTIDLILNTIHRITNTATKNEESETVTSNVPSDVTVTTPQQQEQQLQRKQNVISAFSKLVSSGFIVPAKVLANDDDDDDDQEVEWSDMNGEESHRSKRLKLIANMGENEEGIRGDDITKIYHGESLSIALLLQKEKSYQCPINTVWTVNIAMFHDHLRAYHYGKYVSERYGQNHFRGNNHESNLISCIGSLITAALKYRAYRTYAQIDPHVSNYHGVSYFTVADIMKYIPKSVIQMIEKKIGENSNVSNMNVESSIQQILCDVCSLNYHPHFLRRISDSYSGSNFDGHSRPPMAFEVVLSTISNDYNDRIIYQIVYDRHGAIAARVVSILSVKGYLESDRIADIAMVPAKDTREVLHHLYRSRYVELLQLSNSSRQQYNPNNAIYLWGIERPRLIQRMIDDAMKALHNLRLRRQHEIDTIGAEWLERMTTNQQQQPYLQDHTNNFTTNFDDVDLNITNAVDRANYTQFCIGLERIDLASVQLDDTLMAMLDFPKIAH